MRFSESKEMASKLAQDGPNLFQIQTISMKPISSPEYEERPSNKSPKDQRSNSNGSHDSPLSKKQKALFDKHSSISKKRSGSNVRNSANEEPKQVENHAESHLARQRYLDRHANCQHPISRERSPTSSVHSRNKSNHTSRSSAKQLSDRPGTGRSSHHSHQSSSSEQNHSPSQRRKHKKRASASSFGSWRDNLSRVSLVKEQEAQDQHEHNPIPEETPSRAERVRQASRLKNSTR